MTDVVTEVDNLEENLAILKECEYALRGDLTLMPAEEFLALDKKLSDVAFWVFENRRKFQQEHNRRFQESGGDN